MRIAAAVTPTVLTAALAQIGGVRQLDIKQAPSNKALQAQAVINTHCVNCHGPRRDERVPPLYNHFLLNIYLDNIYDAAIVKHSSAKEGLISNEELAAIQFGTPRLNTKEKPQRQQFRKQLGLANESKVMWQN